MDLQRIVICCIFTAFCVCNVSANSVLPKASMIPTALDYMNNDQIAPLIVGGTPAVSGEFRGKISIQYTNGTLICGGTLIHERHVLTSAFCVMNSWGEVIHPSTYRLMGDDLTISVISNNPNRQLRRATHVFVHPELNFLTFDNDLAIIRTDEPYLVSTTFNSVFRPDDSPLVNTVCSVAGWGSIFNEGPISFQLLRIDATIISRALCNAPTSYNGAVRAGMFCAGNMTGGFDTCQRDGGGGLICNGIVYGIVSWGHQCGLANFPGVYTDIAMYNTWIDSIIVWNDGEHENIPTPTPITTTTPITITTPITTTTPSPGGAGVIFNSIYLLIFSITVALMK